MYSKSSCNTIDRFLETVTLGKIMKNKTDFTVNKQELDSQDILSMF